MTTLLSVADVARLRRCGRHAARRYLLMLENEHQAPLVRSHRAIYIDDDALRQFSALAPRENEARLVREMSSIRRRVTALETAQKKMEAEQKEFRRLAHEWLTKK